MVIDDAVPLVLATTYGPTASGVKFGFLPVLRLVETEYVGLDAGPSTVQVEVVSFAMPLFIYTGTPSATALTPGCTPAAYTVTETFVLPPWPSFAVTLTDLAPRVSALKGRMPNRVSWTYALI
jgi:hypothetical protein